MTAQAIAAVQVAEFRCADTACRWHRRPWMAEIDDEGTAVDAADDRCPDCYGPAEQLAG